MLDKYCVTSLILKPLLCVEVAVIQGLVLIKPCGR